MFIRVRSRKRCIIIRQLQENAVVGVPDKLRGQAVCAYLVLKEGAAATKPQLRRFLMERLASYKVPKYFFFCEQLPKMVQVRL